MEKRTFKVDGKTGTLIDKQDFLSTYKLYQIIMSVNFDSDLFHEISEKRAFNIICINGDMEVAACLLEIWPDINCTSELTYAFRIVCQYGHLEFAKWLLEIHPQINTRDYRDYAFHFACYNGHLEVAKWLFSMHPKIDICSDNDATFIAACVHQHSNIAQWFCELYPNRYSINIVDGDIKYNINK